MTDALILVLLLAVPPTPPPAAPQCPAGQVSTVDTANHCCWPNQVWSNSRNACVGIAQCPAPLVSVGEQCAPPSCPAGQETSADTGGHCCWPNQVWSDSGGCRGVPTCRAGFEVAGEACLPARERAPLQSASPSAGAPVVEPDADLTPPSSDGLEEAEERRHRGMVLVTSRSKGLIIGGSVMLGFGYLATAAVGLIGPPVALAMGATPGGRDMVCWEISRWGLLPVAGPWIALAMAGSAGCLSTTLGPSTMAFGLLTGILQAGGLSMLVIGVAKKTERWVPRDTAPELSLAPSGPYGSPGATVTLRF